MNSSSENHTHSRVTKSSRENSGFSLDEFVTRELRILHGFMMDSYMDSHMDSEWIHTWIRNGFIHGFRTGSEWIHNGFRMDSEWIHTWIRNGIWNKQTVRVACWDMCLLLPCFFKSQLRGLRLPPAVLGAQKITLFL